MERLSDHAREIIDSLHRERLEYHSEYAPLADAINSLAAYEDTGLLPEEIKYALRSATLALAKVDHYERLGLTMQRIEELAQADKEGRIVVQGKDNNVPTCWISVNDRLPEIKDHYCSDEVMVFTADGVMGIDHLEQTAMGGYVFAAERSSPYGDSEIEITHWMPLPEPPKED